MRFLLVLLRAALAHAVREDELPRNVAKNVELSMGTRREIEPLTVEEGRRLLAAARGNRLWAAYELAVRIGLWRGEVLGLRWKDVDLTDGTVTIRQTLQRVGGELLIAAPKTQRSARRVALPAECVTALAEPNNGETGLRRGKSGRTTAAILSSPRRTARLSSRAT
ncbi:tyrosine-type recombinase/integrase [Streptomyces rugosispiralis]|uniref:Tyrosine-type recombinase/integrase n=1 Tax=Streptomyces rugosispiralis TaxID=2967341 RepID=A0ABT1UZU3_9ACTN|nr:tyrosine-type recombinase/integrase [Streptomyces rugosispiralis]MCQ8190645.1 tyrosine-type recombinase/integrase [Streptomyces rugosispiralis]